MQSTATITVETRRPRGVVDHRCPGCNVLHPAGGPDTKKPVTFVKYFDRHGNWTATEVYHPPCWDRTQN